MQTFTGREYLQIDIASNFGLDKKKWSERLEWVARHEDHLEDLVQQAKEPALYYAGVKAYRDVQAGKPIGYMISLDATSSGLQLLAALTGDRSAAELCNVVDTGDRENAYDGIYNRMLTTIQEEGQIDPDQVKQAVMTSLYGSKAEPRKAFGDGALLDVFYETMGDVAPGAWELNEAFLTLWNPDTLSHDWVLPDNFHVKTKVMAHVCDVVHFLNGQYEVNYQVNAPTQEGRSLGANTIHSIDGMIVRELSRRCDWDPETVANAWDAVAEGIGTFTDEPNDQMVLTLWRHYQASGYLSARILDHLDRGNIGHVDKDVISELLLSLPVKPFKVAAIHDCFRVLPHYGNDIRRQYALQLQLIAKSNLLGYLISQLTGRTVQIGKLDPTLWTSIADTNYALS